MKLRLPLPWTARARRLTVREAWLHHDQYQGQRLSLSGVVRAFDADTRRLAALIADLPA